MGRIPSVKDILLNEIVTSALMIFFHDNSPGGRWKLKNKLTEIRFHGYYVSILVDHLRASSDGKLAGYRGSRGYIGSAGQWEHVLH
jgi:hypothetical protein